jgi:hypothetical protein
VIIRAALIDNVERVIHLRDDLPTTPEPTQQGHSVGRWEGGALVVDTTRFLKHASGVRAGVASSRDKHVTERFELSTDRTRLTYSYTLDDPAYLTRPITGSVEWAHRPDLVYTGYACDPGVARRFLKTLRRPKSGIAGAIRYALSRWEALVRYRDDGRIELDNNAFDVHCAPSRSVARTISSWALTPAASVRRPSTRSSGRQSSMASTHKRICGTYSSASPITRLTLSRSCCHGTAPPPTS